MPSSDQEGAYVALRWPPYHVLFHTVESEAAYDDLRDRVLASVRESLAAMDIEVVEELPDVGAAERANDLALIRRALGLLSSMVRCGEPMTAQASETYDAAFAALARREAEPL